MLPSGARRASLSSVAGSATRQPCSALLGDTSEQLRDCPHSLYNEADSSMEASDGLNPASSQGFVEVQAVEALALAKAGQI